MERALERRGHCEQSQADVRIIFKKYQIESEDIFKRKPVPVLISAVRGIYLMAELKKRKWGALVEDKQEEPVNALDRNRRLVPS